jgi:hypothetical protein
VLIGKYLWPVRISESRYEIGRTPVVKVGSPALLRVGLKVNY